MPLLLAACCWRTLYIYIVPIIFDNTNRMCLCMFNVQCSMFMFMLATQCNAMHCIIFTIFYAQPTQPKIRITFINNNAESSKCLCFRIVGFVYAILVFPTTTTSNRMSRRKIYRKLYECCMLFCVHFVNRCSCGKPMPTFKSVCAQNEIEWK